MTTMNWFYKNQIPFEWKYWMTLYAFWIKFELNWNQIPKFNSNTLNGMPISIQQLKLRLNWNEMKCKLLEKAWKISLWIWCWKQTLKVHKSKKTPFHASLLRNGLDMFQFGTIQMMTLGLWNIKLSYLNQFQWINPTKIV